MASPACPSDKSGIKMKMSVKVWWTADMADWGTSRQKLSQHHFVHNKSYTDWPGIEVRPPRKTAVYLPSLLHGWVQILTNVLRKCYSRHTCGLRQIQWPRVLRRRITAARLLGLWVRIPPGTWMFVYCECCVMSGRGLCYELITRPGDSYRLWCVIVCDLEISRMRNHTQSIAIELKIGDVSLDVFPICH
jgi:hypothetical protein